MSRRKIWIAGGALVLASAALAWGIHRARVRSREEEARNLLGHLGQALRMYRLDWDRFPPGDGRGSGGVVRCLVGDLSPHRDLPAAIPEGDIANPVWPGRRDSRGVIHYRCPGIRNRDGFDLWAADGAGRPDGINNWE